MEVLSYGVPTTINDTVIRGLPPHGGRLFITATTAVSIDLSNDPTMTVVKNMTAAAGGAFGTYGYSDDVGAMVAANYIRVVGGSAIVKIAKTR